MSYSAKRERQTYTHIHILLFFIAFQYYDCFLTNLRNKPENSGKMTNQDGLSTKLSTASVDKWYLSFDESHLAQLVSIYLRYRN